MLRRAASRVSLRSRERKLRLFLDLYRPGPETTVVDVGVTDAPFGGGSSDNFFEALYPWPERITAVGHTELDRFAAAFPLVRAVRADGRELPFADGEFDLGFSNAVVEHVAGGREGQRQFVARAVPRRAARVRDDAEPLVPARPAHAAAVRALAARRGPRRDRLFRARGFDDVLDPLGPKRARGALSVPGAVLEPRDDARRRRAPRDARDRARCGRCTCSSSGSRSTTS